jgi:hypothetical protein
MIHPSAANEAILLAQELDSRGLMLTAQPGTPLAELVEPYHIVQADGAGNAKTYTPDVNYIVGVSNNFGDHLRGQDVKHTSTLDAFAMDIGKGAVQSHLKYAKTVVKPLVIELAEEFKKDIVGISYDPYKDTQVVMYDMPKPLMDASLRDDILKLKETPQRRDISHLSLPMLSVTEIAEKMITAQSGLDHEVQIWYASKGEGFLQKVWTVAFTDTPDDDSLSALMMGPDGLDVCLAVYLLASKLHNDPPEGVRSTLGNYNTNLLDLKVMVAVRLAFAMDTYDAFVSTGTLIKTYDQRRIEVVGDVYRKWIEEGGNNSLLLAAVLMPSPPIDAARIDEQRPILQERWERHVSMLRTTMENKRFVRYKELIRSRAIAVVNANAAEIYAEHLKGADGQGNGQSLENLAEYKQFHLKLNEFVYGIRDQDFDNIWDLSLSLVCDCVFYFTDAKKILKGNEAAFLSMIEYVTDYVFDQIQLRAI